VRNSHSLTCEHTSRRACPTHPSGQRRRRAGPPSVVIHERRWTSPLFDRSSNGPVEMGRQAVRSRKIKGQPENYRRDVALSGIASIFKEADRPTIFIVFGTPLSGFCCDAPEGARALPEITLVQYRS
jgi:hypothetical protein